MPLRHIRCSRQIASRHPCAHAANAPARPARPKASHVAIARLNNFWDQCDAVLFLRVTSPADGDPQDNVIACLTIKCIILRVSQMRYSAFFPKSKIAATGTGPFDD